MTVTVSDVIPAAAPAAADRGSPPSAGDSAAGVRARGRDAGANARARIPATQRVGKRFAGDLSRSWVWRDVPPSLQEVLGNRFPAVDRVPAGSPPLRAGWVVWNVVIAVPTTAILYVLAWLLQHPARAAAVAIVAGPIGFFWITNK